MKSVKVLTKVDLLSGEYKICEFPTHRPIRHSIDEYNENLLLKHKRNPLDMDPRFSQHSSLNKFRTKPIAMVQGLNIIGTAHQSQCLTDRKAQKKPSILISLRNSQSNFSKRLNNNLQLAQDYTTDNPFLLSHSNKVKLLHSMPRKKNVFLILPVEMLLDQSNFWRESEPEDAAARVWRKLVNFANIVWLVQKEKTMKKLLDYCERMILPLDAVYLVETKRNKINLTVNLRPMKSDLLLNAANKLIFFGVVKECQTIDNFEVLENQLPLIDHKSVYVHLLKVKTSQMGVFPHVAEILKKQPSQKINLTPIWQQYTKYAFNLEVSKESRSFSQIRQNFSKENNYFREDPDTLNKIERLKKEWTDWIAKMKAMSVKPQGTEGDSVAFIVGDLLRRNYQLLDKFYRREYNPKRKTYRSVAKQLPTESSPNHYRSLTTAAPNNTIPYSFPVFIWNF